MPYRAASCGPLTSFSILKGGRERYAGSLWVNQGCLRISGMVIRFIGSTTSIRGIRSRANCSTGGRGRDRRETGEGNRKKGVDNLTG